MAEFLIRNSLNPHKVVKASVTLTQYVDHSTGEGEPIWLLAVGTSEPDKDTGKPIKERYTNLVTLDNVDEEIEKLVNKISQRVDWGELIDDTRAPYVDSVYPTEFIAKMEDPVEFVIKEVLPAAGIDLSTLKLTANGLDITNELEIIGNPHEYHLKWRPRMKIYGYYDK